MQLHQFLRFLNPLTPVIIFDIQGIEICKVFSKNDIDIDLYEYPILEISTYRIDFTGDLYGISVTIQK